jgi:hypothetical protein
LSASPTRSTIGLRTPQAGGEATTLE